MEKSVETNPNHSAIISVQGLSKTFSGGHQALSNVNLQINKGEIFALLGPNGAGKTTLISTICGLCNPSEGSVFVGGYDIISEYRKTRSLIGLVPQELTNNAFESVWDTVSFSRGLFGKPANPEFIEQILKDLSLYDKKNNKIMTLSGGMKRRVLIAKALSHEPQVLFLDEPTAGVDVELRKDMWNVVRKLRDKGVTIILTTHYIEEAEEMADRIGVIDKGQIILTEQKDTLIKKMGQKELKIDVNEILTDAQKAALAQKDVSIDKNRITYKFDSSNDSTGIAQLLDIVKSQDLTITNLETRQSSLEDIFVDLVKAK